MILLIGGSTHTGKTLAAQRVLEKYSYPYLSIDHLKMGLIRSGICPLTGRRILRRPAGNGYGMYALFFQKIIFKGIIMIS